MDQILQYRQILIAQGIDEQEVKETPDEKILWIVAHCYKQQDNPVIGKFARAVICSINEEE